MSKRLADLPMVAGTCRKCGRAISGFPGDLGKCGHCKVMTLLPGDPPPGWRLVRRPERLMVLPVYFIFSFYASIVAIAMTGGGTGLVGGGVVVVVFAMWIFSIMQFSKAAEHQPRWWLPVLLYHVACVAIPICFWLGLGGCNAIAHSEVTPTALLRVLGATIGLFACMLIYGFARGSLAKLRVVRA
ncbi:MAG: hypothetical protein H6817_07995 [Phycisphaerales bacterium]|nr:hypothetical protein [Phycisphaerales bacterium]